MQNTKMSYVLFSIPVEMLEEAGIGEESVVQISAGNGKIIIDTAEDTDEHCPVSETDCDGNCKSCPCCDSCEEREVG